MKRVLRGTVTSDRRDKTLRVDIERRFRHRKYGKIVRSRMGCQVHDPENTGRMGDLVEIIESPPVSKTKRWQLVKVVQAASDAAVAAGEVDAAAARESEQESSGHD
ncbi:MAG: 30S ribosomal protein S17 [Fuerstiella sp.]|nr:30S ribosomal protein S17 [Fuerstiella sp.]